MINELPERQMLALSLLYDALPNEEIAREMGVSVKAVNKLLKKVYEKMEIEDTQNKRVAAALGYQFMRAAKGRGYSP